MNTNRPVNLESPSMASAVHGFSGTDNGLIRRVSAIVLTAYALVILVSGAIYCDLFSGSYQTIEQWRSFFNQPWVRVLGLLATVFVVVQAGAQMRAGLNKIGAVKHRAVMFVACSVVAVTYAVISVKILWGL